MSTMERVEAAHSALMSRYKLWLVTDEEFPKKELLSLATGYKYEVERLNFFVKFINRSLIRKMDIDYVAIKMAVSPYLRIN